MSYSRSEKFGGSNDGLDEDIDGFLSESEGDSISLASRDTDEESDKDESESETEEISDEHYAAVRSTVIDITTALGGLEEDIDEDGNIRKVYAIGDECLRCLRDLRTLLHQDEDDTTRVIPMIFSEVNVVQRGLLPLLLKAADMGERGSKIALACTDLITTLTWPIDMAAEIQAAINKDDTSATVPDYRKFQTVLVSYKASILRTQSGESKNNKRSVLSTIMLHILLPAISKPRHKRTEREIGTISMCLHLFRNLLAIRDPEATSLSGTELIALSNLQNDLLVELKSSHVLETLLMLSSNAQSRDFEAWNIVTAECVYHIYSSALPEQLILDKQQQKPGPSTSSASRQNTSLQNSLKAESRLKSSEILSSGTSRHSRYSTTINFKDAEGAVRIARTQRALRKTKEELQQHYKEKKQKRRIHRKRALDEVEASRPRRSWTSAAKAVVSEWAKDFVQMGFEPLIRSVVKDIRSESFKAGDIAQTRTKMMRLSNFFLEYFLLQRAQEDRKRQSARQQLNENGVTPIEEEGQEAIEWNFDLIDYWLEPWALKMAWMRANTARDDKTWLEFTTAVKLWTTLLKLVEMLSKSSDCENNQRAEGILAMHFYDELALDAAKAVTKSYHNQSFRCLEAILDFAHVMPKALERYSKDKENLFVKMKKQAKKRSEKDQSAGEIDNAPTNAEEEQEMRQVVESKIKERKFEFERFQSHLSSHHLIDACFTYLARWLDVTERVEEHMSGIVHVLHRLAIKADNLRLFFPYEKRLSIKKIQKDVAFWQYLQSNAPKIVPDAQNLFKYVLEKFERLDETEKGYWAEGMKAPKPVKVFKMPSEIEIIESKGQAEDIKIAIGILMEANKLPAVIWVKSHLEESLRSKLAIVDEVRDKGIAQEESQSETDSDEERERPDKALERASALFNDHQMSYFDDNELRDDASKRPELKLLCRLINLRSNEDDDHHWIWTVPSTHMPEELKAQIEMIEIGMNGELRDEPWSTLVRRIRKQNKITRTVVNEFGEEEQVYVPRQRAPRKENRPNTFVDDLIEDSDEEIEIAERILAQQRMQEARNNNNDSDDEDEANLSNLDDDIASPLQNKIRSSDRSSRSSSVTGSSVHNDISPQKDSQAQKKRNFASIRRKKPTNDLFFGDSEEEDSQQESPKRLKGIRTPSPAGSEPEVEINGDGDENSSTALDKVQQLSSDPAIRKKRALIIDSDDED